MRKKVKECLLGLLQKDIGILIDERTGDFQRRIQTLEENIRNNNELLRKSNLLDDPYSKINYKNFEDHFRGSRELIIGRQQEYLPYFKGKKRVLDMGCGRGEFLEIMKQNNIPAVGVDLYKPFVDECNEMGFDVYHGDAIEYLRNSAPVDGIFVAQLVEHIAVGQILELCRLAYEKLQPGGCCILETPNPMSLAIFTHAFYIDPSHNKPVHPLTLQYYLQIAGFAQTKILFTENSRIPVQIPSLEGDYISNIAEFNESMKEVNEQLFGSQDYAVIAIK